MSNAIVVDGPGIRMTELSMFDPVPFKGERAGSGLVRYVEFTIRYDTWPHGKKGCITVRTDKVLVVITGVMWRTERYEHLNIIGRVINGPSEVIKKYFWAPYTPAIKQGEIYFYDNEHTFQEAVP